MISTREKEVSARGRVAAATRYVARLPHQSKLDTDGRYGYPKKLKTEVVR